MTSLMGRHAGKAEPSEALCFKLISLFVYGQATFLMTASPNVLVVPLQPLKRHMGGRTTLPLLKAALRKLQGWQVVERVQEAFDVAVIKLYQPAVFREAVTAALLPYSLPDLLASGVPKKKAKLIDAAVSRMIKETSSWKEMK